VNALTVRELHVYPIKSARGVALAEAKLTDRGFEHDRRFLVTDRRGVFLTQRELPALARIEVLLAAAELVLGAPGMPEIAAPLRPRAGEARTVRVWRSTCSAIALGDDLARWLSAYLGTECELVYMPDDSIRLVNPAYARDGERVGFADGYPFLLTNAASVAELSGRLDHPVPMNRFRPNIVVDGAAPFAEDGWRALTIGEVPFRVAKPCDRCAITTIDQATGERGKEPLATLAGYRKHDGKVLFGQYLLHRGEGVVRIGDPVRIDASAA
jgi:uncharacterized protein YcbX